MKGLQVAGRPARVLVFSCEPGGAEVVWPAADQLRRQGAEVIIAAYGHGLARFQARGETCRAIDPVGADDLSLLREVAPDLLLTSATSLAEHDMSDRHLWLGARKLGIPSIAFLDQWQNYARRFSGVTPDSHLAYLPDFINCLNDIGARELIQAGVAPERLVCLGHPSLSLLRQAVTGLSRKAIAERLGLAPEEPVALFANEAIAENFGRSRGYDQHDALKEFFRLLAAGEIQGRPVIKLHPKDDPAVYAALKDRYCEVRPLLVQHEASSLECLCLADHLSGMTSIMLIEGYVLHRPVLSIQPGLIGQDACLLSRYRVIPLLKKSGGAIDPAGHDADETAFDWEFKPDLFLDLVGRCISTPSA